MMFSVREGKGESANVSEANSRQEDVLANSTLLSFSIVLPFDDGLLGG